MLIRKGDLIYSLILFQRYGQEICWTQKYDHLLMVETRFKE